MSDEHRIIITIGETPIGSIDVRTTPARAQLDLEAIYSSATPVTALLSWLERYANVSFDDRERVRDTLADAPLSTIVDLLFDIQSALAQGLLLSKKVRKSSSSP